MLIATSGFAIDCLISLDISSFVSNILNCTYGSGCGIVVFFATTPVTTLAIALAAVRSLDDYLSALSMVDCATIIGAAVRSRGVTLPVITWFDNLGGRIIGEGHEHAIVLNANAFILQTWKVPHGRAALAFEVVLAVAVCAPTWSVGAFGVAFVGVFARVEPAELVGVATGA